MWVYGLIDFLWCCIEYFGKFCFRNYIGDVWIDYMNIENIICILVGDDFDKVVVFFVYKSFFDCYEWKFFDFKFMVFFGGFFFCYIDICCFWI